MRHTKWDTCSLSCVVSIRSNNQTARHTAAADCPSAILPSVAMEDILGVSPNVLAATVALALLVLVAIVKGSSSKPKAFSEEELLGLATEQSGQKSSKKKNAGNKNKNNSKKVRCCLLFYHLAMFIECLMC